MKNIRKFASTVLDWAVLSLGGDCELRRSLVDAGALDFSGQGRDKYGK